MRKVIYVVLVAVLIALVVLSLGQMPFMQGGTAVHGTTSRPVVTPTPTPEPTQEAVPEPAAEPVPEPTPAPSPEPAEESPEIPAEAPSEPTSKEPAEATQVPAEEAAAAEAPAEEAAEDEPAAESAAEEAVKPAAEERAEPAAEEAAVKEETAGPAETDSAEAQAEETAEPASEDLPEESAAAESAAEAPAAEEKADAAFAEAEAAYAPVIEKYRALYEDGLNSDRQYIWDNALSEIAAYSEGIGYALRDLDDNGIPELLVAGMETVEFSKSILYDLYTLADGAPVQVVSSQARARYYLLEDNTVLFEGSGGAAYSYIFVNRLKGSELEKEKLLFTNMDGEDTGEFSIGCYYQLGESDELPSEKSVKISQEEFAALLEEMEAGICMPELTRIF